MKIVFSFGLLLTFSTVFSQPIFSEKYLEAGFTTGFTNYSGDMAEKNIQFRENGVGAGLFARYHISNTFALKAQFFAGKIRGTDAHARTPELKERSLKFSSTLLDFAVMAEWNFMNVKPERLNDVQEIRVVPYLMLGIGGVFSQPKVTYYGPPDEFALHVPFNIPEPGLKKQTLVLPFGLGLRTLVSKKITVGIEGGFHPALSDYLDGVKLNGKPNSDWYYTALASASVILGRRR